MTMEEVVSMGHNRTFSMFFPFQLLTKPGVICTSTMTSSLATGEEKGLSPTLGRNNDNVPEVTGNKGISSKAILVTPSGTVSMV
ncbi:MAG: hypothetical protein BWX93_01923 [Bacteroidetes bacterium ADurb.Bin139]|nr:MAG: hypothetical protein BWX93_01923 [Bacteroidetes bacterium ADurb.Bin139]